MIAEGSSKLSSVPSGGGAVSAGGAAAGGASGGAAAEEKAEEKKEEEKVRKRVPLWDCYVILTTVNCRRSPTMIWASVSSTKLLHVYHVSTTMYCVSYACFRSMMISTSCVGYRHLSVEGLVQVRDCSLCLVRISLQELVGFPIPNGVSGCTCCCCEKDANAMGVNTSM